MPIEARAITLDWDSFVAAWLEYAEDNALVECNPNGDSDKLTDDYRNYLDEWTFDLEETPEFIEEFGLSELEDMRKHDTTFYDRFEWEDLIDQEIEDVTGLSLNTWPNNCLDMEDAYAEREADWSESEIDGTNYYYQAH